MNGYNKLKDETIKLTNNQVLDLVDKHFQNMQDLLAKGAIDATDQIKDLLASNETSSALKYLFKRELRRASDMDVNYESVNNKELKQLEKLGNIVASLSEKERECLNNLLKVYGENIKGQDLKSVSVFEKIKLFFQRILRKLKNSDSKANTSLFYWDLESKEGQEPDREITYPEEVLEEEVSDPPILETIVEEDENLVNDATKAASKIETYTEIITPITQIAKEEIMPKATKQLVKPLIPQKSQKVIDASNKIRDSQKIEAPSYTSSCTINLKPAGEKPKIAPKPTVKVDAQAEKQYGKNVASKKQFFESLNDNSNSKPKVKSEVEKLKEKHERFIELASRSPIEQVVSSKGR